MVEEENNKKQKEKGIDKKPLIFVIGTLFFWWFIATSALVVSTCIPEGRQCVVEFWKKPPPVQFSQVALPPAAAPTEAPQPPQSQSRVRRFLEAVTPSRRDVLLFLSLIAAIWVTKAMVFPYEDLSKVPPPKSVQADQAAAGAQNR